MTPKSLRWAALLAGFVLSAGVLLKSGLLHHDLEIEAHVEARRLKEPMDALLQKAFHTKDDLAAQEDVTALARASGVSFACVLDRDDKVIAHSRIAQLGKPFHLPHVAKDVFSFALRDDQARWGTLVFSLSHEGLHGLWTRQLTAEAAEAVIVYVCFLAWLLAVHRKAGRLSTHLAEKEALLADEKTKVQKLEGYSKRLEASAALWLQNAAEHIPKGFIVLDQRQRIVAVNASAARALKIGSPGDWTGKSWCELSTMESFGPALEQSLASPGLQVQNRHLIAGVVFTFFSFKDGQGTSMLIEESKSVE